MSIPTLHGAVEVAAAEHSHLVLPLRPDAVRAEAGGGARLQQLLLLQRAHEAGSSLGVLLTHGAGHLRLLQPDTRPHAVHGLSLPLSGVGWRGGLVISLETEPRGGARNNYV